MGITIDESIDRFSQNAEYERTHGNLQGCLEFRQLTEWLKDYKRLKEQEPTVKAIPLKQLEEMYEKFQKKLWRESEDVRGDDMIEVGFAEESLQEFLIEFGCWDSEVSK